MDRNVLVETLQNEGNLKHSFSAEDIELIAQHMSIETFDKDSILMCKGEPADCMAFLAVSYTHLTLPTKA